MKVHIEESRQRRGGGPDAPANAGVDPGSGPSAGVDGNPVAASQVASQQLGPGVEPLDRPESAAPAPMPTATVFPRVDDSWIETYAAIVRAIMERERARREGRRPAA